MVRTKSISGLYYFCSSLLINFDLFKHRYDLSFFQVNPLLELLLVIFLSCFLLLEEH